MSELVLDASVVIKWFAPTPEVSSDRARVLWDSYQAGEFGITIPPLIFLEVLNVAGRSWLWSETGLVDLAVSLKELAFEVAEADLEDLAPWIAKGLSAYDAAYLALAQTRGFPLITDDARIVAVAPDTAVALASMKEGPR